MTWENVLNINVTIIVNTARTVFRGPALSPLLEAKLRKIGAPKPQRGGTFLCTELNCMNKVHFILIFRVGSAIGPPCIFK